MGVSNDCLTMEETTVLIVGAGPSGIATSACLTDRSIPHVILEKEDCYASLWKKRTYDRLNLHLAKQYCILPLLSPPRITSHFMTKPFFLDYVDNYVSHFNISPRLSRTVKSASFDRIEKKWLVVAKNTIEGKEEVYTAKFLVVASGENGEGLIPKLPGLDSFTGEIFHSNQYKSASKHDGKEVLVVGCGNSGMEIAFDLSQSKARCSILIRNPFHVLTKEMVHGGMVMMKYLPVPTVDALLSMMGDYKYGDLSSFGIVRPKAGPFKHKALTGRSPVIDVGTLQKIKDGKIQVVPDIVSIEKKTVKFKNGLEKEIDAMVFATGYRSVANDWLKDYEFVLNKDGMPKKAIPDHWKGENGLYCAGLSKKGLYGAANDAKAIANDINDLLSKEDLKP